MNWIQLIKKSTPYLIMIIIAFFLMVGLEFYSAQKVMRKHLSENAENALRTAEANVAEGLARSELMLRNACHNIRGILDRNGDAESLISYMKNTADWMQLPVNGLSGFYGVYAYINGQFLDGVGFSTPPDFTPDTRPWYQAAAGLKDGEVAYTAPYFDFWSGNLIVSAVQNLYGLNGAYYGIVVLDMHISWFDQFARSLSRFPGSYGIIANQDLKIINHPDEALKGKSLGETYGGYWKIADELSEKGEVRARRILNVYGEEVVVYFTRIFNGWYVGLIIPLQSYYHDVYSIGVNPAILGLILIIMFSLVMLKINAGRIRSEETNAYKTAFMAQLEETVRQRTGELEVQTARANEASRAKSSFLARMSHEIRTPLNAIIGMTEIARRAPAVNEKNDSLGEIAEASDHLLGVLNDILDMSKIESGKLLIVREPFVLRAAMEEVKKIITQRCSEKAIRFDADFSGLSDAAVLGDKLRLKQVIINLLGNAVKFTSEKKEVRFLAEITARDDKRLKVHFLVSDTGIGMSPDQMENLFISFQQADDTITKRFGGTGLGLAISQNLVQMMGGLITARSALGEGSVFEFTLDMEKTEFAEEKEILKAPAVHDFTGKRVLLVEDIEVNRVILKKQLADTRLIIDEAVDGQDGVEKFAASAEHYYDLILMDVQMPRLDGYDAARQIRSLSRADAAAIPIIAMTANAYREDIDRAMEAGMNAHLAKPLRGKLVKEALDKWF